MASDLRSEFQSEPPADASNTTSTTSTTSDATSNAAASMSPDSEPVEKTDSRAALNLVSGSDGELPFEADSAQDSGRRGIPLWIALVGLVIAALIVGYQMRINGQLEAEVTGLEAKLGRTEAVLDAHQSHLGDIRGGVRDLSAQLQSLQALVETEPVAARDASKRSPQP